MSSLNLLNVFKNREYFDRFHSFVNASALNKEERVLFKDIAQWYDTNKAADSIDWNVFRSWFFAAAHPKLGDTATDVYNMMLDKLDEYDTPDEDFAKATLRSFLMREMCGKVSEITLAGYEGERSVDIEEIELLLDEYNVKLGTSTEVEELFIRDDIDDLVTTVMTGGLQWRSDDLNKSVGSLRPGKLVLFGARPNAGKTTFLADEVSHMASQLDEDQVCIWFNNEEAGKEVKFRIVQGALARSAHDIRVNTVKAKADYIAKVGSWTKIDICDKNNLSVADVEKVLRSLPDGLNVGMIVFDQLWKVHGFEKSAGNDAYRLQMIFQWARELAKQYEAPIIVTQQLDVTAEGMKTLNMGQLHNNKTGIQGECDTIILMGKSNDLGEEKFRYFTVAKNKGAYGPIVDPSLIEHKFIKTINHEVARYD